MKTKQLTKQLMVQLAERCQLFLTSVYHFFCGNPLTFLSRIGYTWSTDENNSKRAIGDDEDDAGD